MLHPPKEQRFSYITARLLAPEQQFLLSKERGFPVKGVDGGCLPSLCRQQQQAEPILTSTSKVTSRTTINSNRGSYHVQSWRPNEHKTGEQVEEEEKLLRLSAGTSWDIALICKGSWLGNFRVRRLGNWLFYSWAFSMATWATVAQLMQYWITVQCVLCYILWY